MRNERNLTTLLRGCPYSIDQIDDRNWWPRRDGRSRSRAGARDAVAHAEELLTAAVAQFGAGKHQKRLE
jgi:hypothetical protein